MSSSSDASAASNTKPSASSSLSSSVSAAGGPVVELDAELLGLHRHAGPAAEVGHEHPRVVADHVGVDVLVGGAAGLAERRGVQPALVRERRGAHVRVGGCGGRLTSSATWRLTAVSRSSRPSGRQRTPELEL